MRERAETGTTDTVIGAIGDLTPGWIDGVMTSNGVEATVVGITSDRVGTGQIGATYRVRLTYAGRSNGGPHSVVVKLAAVDEAARGRVADGYRKEVGFYSEIVGTLDVRTPRCWHSAISDDGATFTLVLDDLVDARPGVQAEGCDVARATDAVANLVGLHAPRWNDPSLAGHDFLTPTDAATAAFLGEIHVAATTEFVERYEDALTPNDVATLHAAARATATWQLARPSPFSLVHGDYRLDNLMFPSSGAGVVALDWQTVTIGPPMRDVAYFIGTCLDSTLRRANEESLVAGYHHAIVGRGMNDYTTDDCWVDYRLGHFQGPMITVLGCIYATAERSERSDGMFLAMATRSCAAIRDLGSLDLL